MVTKIRIDAMQVIIDEYGEAVPIKLVGDFRVLMLIEIVVYCVTLLLVMSYLLLILCLTRRPLIHILIFLATYGHRLIMYLVLIMMSVILISVILSR